MAIRVADGPYIGLLVPDTRAGTANLRVNDGVLGNSDYTEAGPRPGVPEFDAAEVAVTSTTAGNYSPSLSLEAIGEQDSGTSYHLKCLKGGMPGTHATVARRDSLTSGDWRGWNTHNVPGHLERDYLIDRDGTGAENVCYSATTTADGQALFVWWKSGLIEVRKYDPGTHTAGPVNTAVDTTATINSDTGTYQDFAQSYNLLDALVLPSGRVVIYYLTREIDGLIFSAQLWCTYSDDDGATWRTGQYLGLDSVLDLTGRTPLKLRAAYSRGNVLLIVEKSWLVGQTTYTGLVQYASDDTGLNFTLIRDGETESSIDNHSHPDIVVDGATGAFVVVYEHDLNNALRVRRLASPYTPYTEGDLVTIVGSGIAADHVVAYSDTDGAIYVTYDTTDGIDLYSSRDGGQTWAQVEEPYNWNGGGTNEYRWDITAAGGRACWLIGQTASSGSLPLTDHKMFILEMGGWNTLCQPRILGQDPTVNRGFGSTASPDAGTWLPTEKPELYGWTRTGSTVGVSGVVPLGLPLTIATHYSTAPAGASTDGMVVYFGLHVDSAGSVAALNIGLHLILDTFDVEVRLSSTQVRIRDIHGAVDVGTASVSMSSENIFKIALRKSGAAANGCSLTLYRRAPASDVWSTLITTSTLTAGASVANLIDWGHFVAGEDSRWTYVHYVMDPGNGDQGDYYDDLSQDVLTEDPMVLYGAPLPVPPYKLYVDQGLYIRGTSGPATRGDTWKIEPRFDFPISALDPANSATPQRGWRSTGTTQATVAWDMTLDSSLGGSSIGLYLGGINFPSCQLLGWNGAAWAPLATLQANQGLTGLPCTVTGDTLRVNTGSASSARYITYGEYVGGYVRFSPGNEIRKITWNSEGTWTDSTTKRPVFRFVGGAIGATTTCELWHPSALVLLHENLTTYDRYALQIPSQSTYEGDYRIGICLLGHVAYFGRKNSHGRVIETAPNYSLREDQAGHRTVKMLGRSRRAVTFGWSDVDLTAISGSAPDPDYITLRDNPAAPPVADRYGAPLLIEGLLEELGGATVPVVYIPSIPETTPGNQETRIASREGYVYGRIVSSVSRQARIGTELVSEVASMTGVRIEEEV